MGFKIIVDSCCDAKSVPGGIPVINVPLRITIDGKTYTDDGTLNTIWLLSAMRGSKALPVTACPSPAEYAEAMSGEDDVFVVTLSAELSGSYQSAMLGAEMKKGGGRVHVFNSQSASAGQSRITLEIADMISRGLTFDQIVVEGEEFVRDMKTFFVLQSLDSLIKAGRMGKITGSLATFMQLRPIMSDDGTGGIMLFEKARGTKNAIDKLVNIIGAQEEKMRLAGRPKKPLCISHCNCPELALDLKKKILEKCPGITDVGILPTGGLSTFYAFDGGIVVGY